jgi:hypothetical protein
MKKGFDQNEVEYLKKNYLKYSSRVLAQKMNCSKTKISYHLKKLGLIVPKDLIEKFRIQGLSNRTTATKEEDDFIKKNYLTMPVKTIGACLGRSGTPFVSTRIKQLGLVIPQEIIEQRKIDSRFSPGSIPANKGLKQTDYMTADQIKKTAATRFKKGNVPLTTLYNGIITKRKDTLKTGEIIYYKWIRISKANWKMLHVYNWEKVYGPLPEGYILVFKDGDKMNCDVNNVEKITLQENMRRNSIQHYPEEIRNLMITNGKLKSKIKKHKNHGENN